MSFRTFGVGFFLGRILWKWGLGSEKLGREIGKSSGALGFRVKKKRGQNLGKGMWQNIKTKGGGGGAKLLLGMSPG